MLLELFILERKELITLYNQNYTRLENRLSFPSLEQIMHFRGLSFSSNLIRETPRISPGNIFTLYFRCFFSSKSRVLLNGVILSSIGILFSTFMYFFKKSNLCGLFVINFILLILKNLESKLCRYILFHRLEALKTYIIHLFPSYTFVDSST